MQKNSKEKGVKCSAALRSNTVSVRCSVCSKGFYQKCSTVLKASTPDIHWKCKKCTNIQHNRTYQSTNRLLPGSTNSLPSKPVPATSRNKLKIYQWNADGIRPKFIELCDHRLNSDIDVLAVQESKLRETDQTLSIKGYATIRKDHSTFLEAVYYSPSERTSCSRKYTLSKKLAWRSCPFVSRLLNQLGLIPTMLIYQTLQLNIIHSTRL